MQSPLNAKSKAILQERKCRKKNICMAWINYQKSFGSVAHRCIIKFLELIVINNKIISFTIAALTYWKTGMRLHTEWKIIETEHIE